MSIIDLTKGTYADEVELLETTEELPTIVTEELCHGLRAWSNSYNRFRVLRLEHTADPSKRSKKWEDETRAGMAHSDWLREYKIVWRSFKGKPVYLEDWKHDWHVSKEPLKWNPELSLMRGWDFGMSPACVISQLWPRMRLLVLREVVGKDISVELLIDEVARLCGEWFPGARQYFDIIDPSGFFKRDLDGRTAALILAQQPLRARPIGGVQDPTARRHAVVEFLRDSRQGQPCFMIDPSCETLIQGFDGGFHFTYMRGVLRDRWEKNHYSHSAEALQYICTKARNLDMSLERQFVVAEPRYLGRPSQAQEALRRAVSA